MKTGKRTIWIAASLATVVLVCLGLLAFMHAGSLPWDIGKGRQLSHPIVPVVGQPAPDFTILLLDGNTFRLEDQRGKAVLVNFWASWCDPCRSEMPLLEELHQKYADRMIVLGIDDDESRSVVLQFVRLYSLHFRIGIDVSSVIGTRYLVNGLPTTFFIDSTGTLQAIRVGALDGEILPLYLSKIGITP